MRRRRSADQMSGATFTDLDGFCRYPSMPIVGNARHYADPREPFLHARRAAPVTDLDCS